MKIIIADTAGFCMGVKRAVDLAFDHVRLTKGPVYTYGPLIHNPQVLDLLAHQGVGLLTEIPEKGVGSVIIRAHGIPPQEREALQQAGFEVVDATCPKVVKVHKIIEKYYGDGYAVIILGERDHAEIVGLNGYADNRAHIVRDLDEVKDLPDFDKAVVVAQTTLNLGLFNEVRAWLKESHPDYKIINTICDSTEKRQLELKETAAKVDGFIVVGGFESGNTRRLAEVARETGKPSIHVESEAGLTAETFAPFAGAELIALSAGASTPNWTIQSVAHTAKVLSLPSNSARARLAKLIPVLYLLHAPLALACLTYICQQLYDFVVLGPLFPLLAFLYGWAMHTTSKISGTRAAAIQTPLLTVFYQKHRQTLVTSCAICAALALILAFYAGPLCGLVLLLMYFLRILYDFLPMAGRLTRDYTYFIDLPYSKSVSVALAWSVIAAVLPLLQYRAAFPAVMVIVMVWLWAALVSLARVMAQDLFAIQYDRINGHTTLMLLLGLKTGAGLLGFLLLALFVYPVIIHYLGFITSTGLLSLFVPLLMFYSAMYYAFNRDRISATYNMDMLVSLGFVITAVLILLVKV